MLQYHKKSYFTMKIYIKCKSILLQKTLNTFLSPYVAIEKNSEFYISDYKFNTTKPVFFIGSHIKKPFTKDELLQKIEEFYKSLHLDVASNENAQGTLEQKVGVLVDEFKKNLLKTIKDHHEK